MALYKCPTGPILPSWANATDAELADILNDYYNGRLTLNQIKQYWHIGDERTVNLSAMEATGVSESHVAQPVTFVLMNWGGKTLSNNVECLAIVGQKEILGNGSSSGNAETGRMNSSNTNAGGWDQCERRTWCNNVYRNAIPSNFRNLFKQFKNVTADGPGDTTATSTDYFALPSEKEVLGSASRSSSTAEASNSQFEYYVDSTNRLKKRIGLNTYLEWYLRSPSKQMYSDQSFCSIKSNGAITYVSASITRGISPFGCI